MSTIIQNSDSRIRFSKEEMIADYVEVKEAPRILVEKLTGEGSHENKFFHLFSKYSVRPVACSRDAGTTLKQQPGKFTPASNTGYNAKGRFQGLKKESEVQSDRNLTKWSAENGGGPGKFFTNSSKQSAGGFIQIPKNLSVAEQMEFLMKHQEKTIDQFIGGIDSGKADVIAEDTNEKIEKKEVIQAEEVNQVEEVPQIEEVAEPPKAETDVKQEEPFIQIESPPAKTEKKKKKKKSKNKNQEKSANEVEEEPAVEQPPPEVQEEAPEEAPQPSTQVPEAQVEAAAAKVEALVAEAPAAVRPKASGPKPIKPENLAKRDIKTGSKLVLGQKKAAAKSEESSDGVPFPTLPEKKPKSKNQTKQENYFKVEQSEKEKVAKIEDIMDLEPNLKKKAPVSKAKPKPSAPKNDFYIQELQKPQIEQKAASALDEIMAEQEKDEKFLKKREAQELEKRRLQSQKHDIKFMLNQADRISSNKPKHKPSGIGGGEREEIIEARQKYAKAQPPKKEEEYYVNQYGIKKLVNPPEKPKPQKKKKGKKGQAAAIDEVTQEIKNIVQPDPDSDSDETAQAKKFVPAKKQPAQKPANSKPAQTKKGKKAEAPAKPTLKKSAYGSESDSDDDEMSFIPKSLQKKEAKQTAPMSKRAMKKNNTSSLATLYDQKTLKQKMKMSQMNDMF